MLNLSRTFRSFLNLDWPNETRISSTVEQAQPQLLTYAVSAQNRDSDFIGHREFPVCNNTLRTWKFFC